METFNRVEKKYLLDLKQYKKMSSKLKRYMKKDEYHISNMRSIYYDSDSFELIRRSIEKPVFKEKLRIRSYEDSKDNDDVYVELKKKLDGVVYKRRTRGKLKDVLDDIYTAKLFDPQIDNEIKYALNYYPHLSPKVYIGSKRLSYKSRKDLGLRITFDEKIKYRFDNLSLKQSKKDKLLTDKIVMEIKASNSYPLWLTKTLDELKIYPTSFSKVGSAYLKNLKENS